MTANSPGGGKVDTNVIYCGDNLDILKGIQEESVDLIYIDPPFFSNRRYEVIWGDEAETRSFEDRWEGGSESGSEDGSDSESFLLFGGGIRVPLRIIRQSALRIEYSYRKFNESDEANFHFFSVGISVFLQTR